MTLFFIHVYLSTEHIVVLSLLYIVFIQKLFLFKIYITSIDVINARYTRIHKFNTQLSIYTYISVYGIYFTKTFILFTTCKKLYIYKSL